LLQNPKKTTEKLKKSMINHCVISNNFWMKVAGQQIRKAETIKKRKMSTTANKLPIFTMTSEAIEKLVLNKDYFISYLKSISSSMFPQYLSYFEPYIFDGMNKIQYR